MHRFIRQSLMQLAFLFFIWSFSVLSAASQKIWKDGWIVTNNGDTLKGQIKEKDWFINPDKIEFSKSKQEVYTVKDISAFGIIGGNMYRRYSVEKHPFPVSDNALYPENENPVEKTAVWLKIITQGEISLASLNQKERVYFYAIDKAGSSIELLYGRGQKNFAGPEYKSDPRYGKTLLLENNEYRTQINLLFPENNLKNEINNLTYSERSLEKVFLLLTNSKKQVSAKGKLQVGVAGGISLFSNSVISENTTTFWYGASVENSTSPFLKVYLQFVNSRKRNRMNVVLEAGFTTLNTTGTRRTVLITGNYDIKNFFLETGLLTRYNFNAVSKNGIYAAAGLSILLKAGGNNTYTVDQGAGGFITTNEPKQKNFMVVPSVILGYSASAVDFFVNYQPISDLTRYISSSLKSSRISIGVGYRFVK